MEMSRNERIVSRQGKGLATGDKHFIVQNIGPLGTGTQVSELRPYSKDTPPDSGTRAP